MANNSIALKKFLKMQKVRGKVPAVLLLRSTSSPFGVLTMNSETPKSAILTPPLLLNEA
jgi:hypothetical protein